MRLSPLLLAFPVVYACSLGPQLAGNADVTGQVVQSSGQPLANSSVVIDCGAGGTTKTVPTDTEGRYGGNLSAPAPDRIRCVFAVPDFATPRIRVDTAIGFAPFGQLHPLQIIDLREAAAP
jgi:hypothetical protein